MAACFPTGAKAQQVATLAKFGAYGFSFGNPVANGTAEQLSLWPAVASVQEAGVSRVVSTPFHGFDFPIRVDGQIGSDSIMGRYLFNRGNTFNNS